MKLVRRYIQRFLARFGYRLQNVTQSTADDRFRNIHEAVRTYTMTSYERQQALFDAVNYIEDNRIEGAIVECGVWKGGSSMLAALTLLERGSADRTLYLYDTYAGMSEPTASDVNIHGRAAGARWRELARDGMNEWDYASLDEVRSNLRSTGYPESKTVFVKGKVEETVPGTVPERIALLRLDTDWYESTRHELEHLFPRLVRGGVLILDDYGHWQGARKAVDEYFKGSPVPIFLNRIDYTGRIAVKL
ncbi:MAG: O-methyltransferase [Candidatus Parcubacteria bacterium]|jgi:hypothetical protein|nr:O-methyltransferase [Candidatus Parcubacteria bacterium]